MLLKNSIKKKQMSVSSIDLKPKINPLLEGLSDYVKNPANFEKIQKNILDTFLSTCGHSEVIEWANCKKCTDKMLARRRLLKKYGFKNAAQYYAWRKIHEQIKIRYPLVDWAATKI